MDLPKVAVAEQIGLLSENNLDRANPSLGMGLVKPFIKVPFRFFLCPVIKNIFFLLFQVKNTEETNPATTVNMNKTARYLELKDSKTQNIFINSFFFF